MKRSSSNITDHENGPCFYKIMQLSHSLRIPPDFVTTHLPKRFPKKAVLKSPSGGRWRVSILKRKEAGEVSLEQGWQQFFQHHSLGDGEFLVFRHTGNMCFDVEIYDESGCKRENVSTTQGSSSTAAEDNDEEEEDIEIVVISETETEPLVPTKRKRKT